MLFVGLFLPFRTGLGKSLISTQSKSNLISIFLLGGTCTCYWWSNNVDIK